jgi:DNA-binding transcriptional LysR family regulator
MDIKLDDLHTFIGVYSAGTFTKASRTLGLSQSALSQKIARMEEALQTAIFIRHPRSLTLTASGEKLLVYAKETIQMQKDFLENFDQYQSELSGVIRIAGFSSVMRSLIIPQFTKLIRKHSNISIEFSSYEMSELEDILKSNKADFIITDYFPNLSNTNEKQISEEEYIIIESRKHKVIPNTYLDHGSSDNATKSYFDFTGKKQNFKRAFVGDTYSIIDAVALGLGRAVMSKHLVETDKRFKIMRHQKKYIRPVVLSYMKQNYYGPLQQKILEILLKTNNLLT